MHAIYRVTQNPRNAARWLLLCGFMGTLGCQDDSLTSTSSTVRIDACDRGRTCGCQPLNGASTLDLGSPSVDQTASRLIILTNSSKPWTLSVTDIAIHESNAPSESPAFSVSRITVHSAHTATVAIPTQGVPAFDLVDDQWAEITIAFSPVRLGLHEARLEFIAPGSTAPVTPVSLRGGGASGSVHTTSAPGSAGSSACVCEDGQESCTCACDNDCGVDFGTFDDSAIAVDLNDPEGRATALGTQEVTVFNDGSSDLTLAVELTRDGIPETHPEDHVGDHGVFFLTNAGCAIVPAGEQRTFTVEYRPSAAGEHLGALAISGAAAAGLSIDLTGRVVGGHLCLRTQDEQPHDGTLRFGTAPAFTVPANSHETRNIWASNCGFGRDLILEDITTATDSSPEFVSPVLPWSEAQVLAVGDEFLVPVQFTPALGPGTYSSGRYLFHTNEALRPLTVLDLAAQIGEPERCQLTAIPGAVDFGWVGADEESVGFVCPPPPFPCPGISVGPSFLSRRRSISIVNRGQRACHDITLGAWQEPEMSGTAGSGDYFSIDENPNGVAFTLEAGASSAPIELLFVRQATTTPLVHAALLPFTSTDSPAQNIAVTAAVGGAPFCRLAFQPVGAASILCSDETLAFGSVNFGLARTIALKVTNTGGETCTVTNIARGTSTSPVFSWTAPALPLRLPVQESFTMPVTFRAEPETGVGLEDVAFGCMTGSGLPGMPAPRPQTMLFDTVTGVDTAAQSTRRTLQLSGKGKRPDIDVIPGALDFGDVTVGCCSAARNVRIYNTGDTSLTIVSTTVLDSSEPGFGHTSPGQITIGPNASAEISANFCPTRVGDHTGQLHIQSNVEGEVFTVGLQGAGVLDSSVVDTFDQPARPMVDVLWSIDNSGSMSNEQQTLADNFDAFINRALELDTDYHMGVVVAESESERAGELYACDGALWIHSDEPAQTQRDRFKCNVKVSDSDRPSADMKESPLQAARLALDYPKIDGINAGFYRDQAKLYVIVVSDEKDQSNGTAQLYVDYFSNLKGVGNPDLLSLAAISGPPPSGCDSADANQMAWDAVQSVGGQFKSICSADWNDLIAGLGLDVFNARRQFPLSRTAASSQLAPIAVQVCNVAPVATAPASDCHIVANNATDGWTYDAGANAIVFHGGAVPEASQHIRINYEAHCFSAEL